MEILTSGYMIYIVIFLTAALGYIISILSGGGGSLLLIPIVSFLIGAKAIAPVINLGNLIGEPIRLIIVGLFLVSTDDWHCQLY